MNKTIFLKNSIIAHRGIFDNKKTIENTVGAFKKSINKGYAIELDLHLTKDNKIVVFHDDKLDRLTNEKGYIKDKNLDELKGLKLLNTDNYIPTFDEVLSLVNGKVPLLIELKPEKGYTLEKEVAKTLSNYSGEYAVQSFNPKSIIWFRLFKKDIVRGLLISSKSIELYNSLKSINFCKPDFINVNKELLDDNKISNFKGIKLAYTIEKGEKDKYSDKCDNMICNI
jgi:glycerophosphoryl diester phosphodiesterase